MKLLRKPNLRDGWYEISPGDAQKALDSRSPNRPIRESRATIIASEILRGRFAENGETIIFDEKDRLVDGQHRLRAVVLANKSINSYCIFGVGKECIDTIDDCSKRTAGDVLGMRGHANAMVAAAVARWLLRYESGFSLTINATKAAITNRVISETMKKNKDIQGAVDFVVSLHGIKDILPYSVAGFCFLMASRYHQMKAHEFFSKLASGDGLASGSPILTLRNRFIGMKGEKGARSSGEYIALVIKAWNAFICGKKMSLVRYSGKNANESFPRFGDAVE